jgi:hypothetical protein
MKYPRRGITLMEVLISIFVASVGLMGLAALIPVGRHYVVEASKQERGNAVGRAAFREIKVRGWLKPENLWGSGGAVAGADLTKPFCIDPLFVAYPANNSAGGAMTILPGTPPWNDGTGWLFPTKLTDELGAGVVATARMPRATLKGWSGATIPMTNPSVERMFRSEDDLVFELPSDETKRPNVVWGSDDRIQSAGDYTWLATVVPSPWPYPVTPAPIAAPKAFSVSVAVCYKRSPLAPLPAIADRGDGPPSERVLYADFISGGVGYGGGDVLLRLPIKSGDPNSDPANVEKSDFPKVRPGQWIMLGGWTQPAAPIPPHEVYHWYRVVATGGDPSYADSGTNPASASGNPEWFLEATLAGPDWAADSTMYQDADGAGAGALTLYATVIDGVVGVYTKTIEVDSWAQ